MWVSQTYIRFLPNITKMLVGWGQGVSPGSNEKSFPRVPIDVVCMIHPVFVLRKDLALLPDNIVVRR